MQRGLEIIDVLGVGGSSIVYRARDPRHDRDVAVKVLRTDSSFTQADSRFEREMRVAGSLRHQNLLPLFDSGRLSDGRRFAVMPVAQGRPLRAMISEGPLTVEDSVRLTREVGEALAHMHSRGWVHRDVKPENILVEGGHAVLTDFGIATPMDKSPERPTGEVIRHLVSGSTRITEVGAFVGTPAYMSPETMRDDAPVDGRSDQYSLGLVLYEMLAGRLPPGRDNASSGDARDAVPKLRGVRSDVPSALDDVIQRATRAGAADRFPSVRAMTDALAGIHPVPGGAKWIGGGSERRPQLVIATFVLVLLAAIAGMYARRVLTLDPSRIVVADFLNETGRTALDPLGELASDVVTAALSNADGLTVINAEVVLGSRQRSPTVAADSLLEKQSLALVRQTRAGVIVTGSYFAAGQDLAVIAEVTDTRSGRVIGVFGPVTMKESDQERVLRAAGDSVVAIIRRRHQPPP